uniref:DALR anticodon-binding domain-containing protein n=1 Tax=Trichocoleus desertorum TaxID=1481672 RepID=UPI0025B5F376|nr:DALR anticodon-binding domain-containing protein [Trichocoleus desertorum]
MNTPISLQRVKGTLPVLYRSAIALQLAKPCRQPGLKLADAIAESFSQGAIAQKVLDSSGLGINSLILRNFTVKVEPPGWLSFELATSGLAAWLQCLTQAYVPLPEPEYDLVSLGLTLDSMPERALPNSSDFSGGQVFDLFTVQYAHARCAALLRLAGRQSELTEDLTNTGQNSPSAIALQPIPWLSATGELRLTHATEQSLIFVLIDTVDELLDLVTSAAIAQSPPLGWQARVERLASALAQAFLSFYDACRFWGEVQQRDPALVQARLGLVLATQLMLQGILRDFLGLIAPAEL